MRSLVAAVIVSPMMASGAWAQAPPATPSAGENSHPSPADPAGQPPRMGHAMMGQGTAGGIMCPMMGGAMGQGMSGMDTMARMMASDPKTTARLLKLRGEMMKAMGEVMVKHGQALDQEK